MVFGTGGFPRNNLDPSFFDREAHQLSLTPEMVQHFKKASDHLMNQLQSGVDSSLTDLTSFLKEAKDLPEKKIVDAIQAAQQQVDTKFQSYLDQTKQTLLKSSGQKYAHAIEQFVQDVEKEIAPFKDLAEKLRQDPSLKGHLPLKSIFELSQDPQKMKVKSAAPAAAAGKLGASDPLDPYIQAVQEWAGNYPGLSTQATLAKQIVLILNSFRGQNKSFAEIIAIIEQQIYPDPEKGQDIYLQHFGLSKQDLDGLSAALSSPDGKVKLSVPPFTQMDKHYVDAYNWTQKASGSDRNLAIALFHELESLGSSDKFLDSFKKWGQDFSLSDTFCNASDAAANTFCDMTGADPLQGYLERVEKWQAGYKDKNSPQYQLADAIIKQIKSLIGHTRNLADLITAIDKNVYFDPHGDDIYMRFFGLTQDQMQSLSALLSGGSKVLKTPTFTEMDKKYQAVQEWLADKTISPNDRKLAEALLNELKALGSDPAQLGPLQKWAQAFTSDPTFTNASIAAQTEFCQITGAMQPVSSLDVWEKLIADYLKERTDAFDFLLLQLGIPPAPLPKTEQEWKRLTKFANQLNQDIALATQQGTQQAWSQLAAKWGLAPGGIETIQNEAAKRLEGYQKATQGLGDQSAIKLYSEILTKIKQLEANGGSTADLQAWAKGINLSNYPGLTDGDKQEFNKLLSGHPF